MADVTVKELAESVGTSVERLLQQLKDAGLQQKKVADVISDDDRQVLLSALKTSHGGSTGAPTKITLKRNTRTVLNSGQGGKGKKVAIEVRKKRTYVKRTPVPEVVVEEKSAVVEPVEEIVEETIVAPIATPTPESQVEAPVEIQSQEAAEPDEPVTTPTPVAEPEEEPLVKPVEVEPVEEEPAKPVRKLSHTEMAAEEIRRQDAARISAEEETNKVAEQRKIDSRLRKEAAELKLKEEAEQKAREAAQKTRKPSQEEIAREAGLKAQAAESSSEKSGPGKRSQRGGGRYDNRGKGGGRKEISLKGRRRRAHKKPLAVETHGGQFEVPTVFKKLEVEIGDLTTVGELAQAMSVKAGEVLKTLMNMGVMATINQSLDQDTATLLVEEMGHGARYISEDAVEIELEESLNVEGDATPRCAVVTVMGHVDHGKTSLLDYIRKSKVVSGEAGGITQHIGAYHVETDSGAITFLDTPGHAAFTSMRARGAQVTDIVVLVVAADDGVMPQTEEAIQHAKSAGVPIVVAVNKMDLEGADPDRVKNELAAKDVIPDDWGGDTQFVHVSAITGDGIDKLLEALVLQAELLELTAVTDAPGRGVVVEARLDRGRGAVATVLVKNGTVKQGQIMVAGEFYGRVRAMSDDAGEVIKQAGPSTPVEILGLSGTPAAGDDFSIVPDDKKAREVAEFRKTRSDTRRVAAQQAARMDNLFANLQDGELRVMNLVIKTDVRGSLEAISQSLVALGNKEVKVNIVRSAVGGITESDVVLAVTAGAVIFGFNVRADGQAKKVIATEGVELRYYSVIYELLDDVKAVLSGMLAPEIREEIVGTAEVRDVFRSPKFGQIAGSMVIEGTIHRNKKIRVLRDDVVIYEGELESLRRFKDDVAEVRNGLECGIGVRNYTDVRVGDKIEVFDTKEIERTL